jgi:hypothetical protein
MTSVDDNLSLHEKQYNFEPHIYAGRRSVAPFFIHCIDKHCLKLQPHPNSYSNWIKNGEHFIGT